MKTLFSMVLLLAAMSGWSQLRPSGKNFQPRVGFTNSLAGGGGSITFLTSVAKNGTASDCTTAAIDSSGANLIVLIASYYSTVPTISDSKGNSWTPLTERGGASDMERLYYCLSPASIGSGHTFDLGGIGADTQYATLRVLVFSGVTSYAAESGANFNNDIGAPGSISGKLFVTGASCQGNVTLSIGSSFNIDSQGTPDGTLPHGAAAYKINGSSGAENPVWTGSGTGNSGVAMAAFE